MKKTRYYILLTGIALVMALMTSCSRDDDYSTEKMVLFSVVNGWQKGTISSRAMTRPDAPTEPCIDTVYIKQLDKETGDSVNDFVITKDSKGVWNAPGDITLTKEMLNDYKYMAKAMNSYPDGWPAGDVLWGESLTEPWDTIPAFGTTDYLYADTDDRTITADNKVVVHLQHQTTLMRFVLGVSDAYDKLRTFKVKDLVVKSESGEKTLDSYTNDDGEELSTTGIMLLSFHFDPDKYVDIYGADVVVTAKYDVYDKSGQLTRKDCTASNKLTLPRDKRGCYYDVMTTLDPDFLYVLSDNDNGADLVLK